MLLSEQQVLILRYAQKKALESQSVLLLTTDILGAILWSHRVSLLPQHSLLFCVYVNDTKYQEYPSFAQGVEMADSLRILSEFHGDKG
jgi:hypothetical protein